MEVVLKVHANARRVCEEKLVRVQWRKSEFHLTQAAVNLELSATSKISKLSHLWEFKALILRGIFSK